MQGLSVVSFDLLRESSVTTHAMGLGAAWPSPQIDASAIACDRSVQQRLVPAPRASARPPSPCRRGTACIGRTTRRRRIRIMLSAASRARSWCDSTTTAAEPMKQPCGCSVSKSSGTSPSDAGRMPAGCAAGQVAVEVVAVQHAAAVLVDQLAHGDARRREMHARLLSRGPTPRTSAVPCGRCGPAPRTTARRLSGCRGSRTASPCCARASGRPKRPDLRDVRRAQPRHAALAFDRLDHRRLLAADVRAGTAAQVDRRQRARRIGCERGDLAGEDRAARRRTRRADRRRRRRCRPPTRRSACLRGSGADRARGSSDP